MKSAYLVMVESSNNHNKYYQMTQKTADVFEVQYGRVGAKGMLRTYPISRWDSIYQSKLAKGYIDNSSLYVPVKKSKYNEISDVQVRTFWEEIESYSKKVLESNYSVSYEKVTSKMINFHTANLRPTKSLGVREPRVWLSETKRKTPECSGVSFFRAGNSNSLTNAFHICVYVHLCVVPRYIASQHPWKQSQSLLQNTKETTAGHFRRSVFLLSGRIPGVHELLWKAASLSCGRYR